MEKLGQKPGVQYKTAQGENRARDRSRRNLGENTATDRSAREWQNDKKERQKDEKTKRW